MLAGGGLLAVPPLPVLPLVLPVVPLVLPPELLDTVVPDALLPLPESAVLLEPPPQAARAAARIGNPIIHDPFFKAEAP